MARFKYYRYKFKDKGKLPRFGYVRTEDDVVVYDRPLTPKEVQKAKLVPQDDDDASILTKYRMAKGLTQFELAEEADIPRNAIQRYEINGIGTCPISYAKKLAKALDITVQDLADE